MPRLLSCCLLMLAVLPVRADLPIFDTHLHYSEEDAAVFTPSDILSILDAAGVHRAVVTATPNAGSQALHRHAPKRIVPFLSAYRGPTDKRDWMHDPGVPQRLQDWLQKGHYRGIGELHIFAPDRHNPVFHQVVELAADRGLFLLLHGDAEIIDEAFAIAPGITVLWAHLGTRPEPGSLRRMLARHPERLYLDTSVRDERFTDEQGRLRKGWRDLFTDHADRFLVGVDSFSVNRWRQFGEVATRIRAWLAQLPADVADRLAHGNAERLFGGRK